MSAQSLSVHDTVHVMNHVDWNQQLGCFSDGPDGAVLLLRFFVEKLETNSCVGAMVWPFSLATYADDLSCSPTQNNLIYQV